MATSTTPAWASRRTATGILSVPSAAFRATGDDTRFVFVEDFHWIVSLGSGQGDESAVHRWRCFVTIGDCRHSPWVALSVSLAVAAPQVAGFVRLDGS